MTLHTCHGVSISIQPHPVVLSCQRKVTWKNVGKHVFLQLKERIMTNINNATAEQAVRITERTENNQLAYKSHLCWWKYLHARDRGQGKTWKNGRDNKMKTATEGRKPKWMIGAEIMIKIVRVCVCFLVFYECENKSEIVRIEAFSSLSRIKIKLQYGMQGYGYECLKKLLTIQCVLALQSKWIAMSVIQSNIVLILSFSEAMLS